MDHYCQEHKTKFYENKKTKEDGSISVWYSHKKDDGTYCNEKKPSSGGRGGYQKDPESQRRIQRQHSQEMSIRALEFMFKVDPEGVRKTIKDKGLTEVVGIYTSIFEKDLEPK